MKSKLSWTGVAAPVFNLRRGNVENVYTGILLGAVKSL